MADVDARLADSLKQAKSKPMFFAFVAKGNEGKVLVDKKKVTSKDAAEAKKACGGGTIYQGRCQGEDGKMVFHVGKQVPATLNALTKKIIKQDAGLTLEVEYRVAADLAAEENQAEATGEGGSPTAAVPSPPETPASASQAAPPPASGGAEVIKRLNGMGPNIKAALAGPNKARVQTLFVSVNGLIKNKDFLGAQTALDELEPLLAKPTGAPASPSAAVPPAPPETAAPTPPPANDAALAAEWERRVIALEPRVLEAQKTRAGEAKWLTMFMTAQDLGRDEDFTKSMAILDRLEGLLSAPPKVSEAPAASARWNVARDAAVAKLKDEIKAVLATKDPDAGQAELELKAVLAQLTGKMETKRQAAEMERYLKQDGVVADVCEMAFDLKSPLLNVLAEITAQLPG